MGENNGAASELADEMGLQMFADHSPPVNYCGELNKAEAWRACL